MYTDRLRLRLPKGVFPYLEAVDELLLLTQIHQRKGTKKKFFKKNNKYCTNKQYIKQVKQIAILKYKYSSSQTAEFHPLLRDSRYHSTLQP